MKQRKRVALLIETSNAYARGLLEGIVEYQRQRDGWSVYLPEQERGAAPPSWLRKWDGDGMIARIENAAIALAVSKLSLPVVDVSSARRVADIPWVETDDRAIASLAFEHLYERGFRKFAFCGPRGFNWSQWRREHFVQRCHEAGYECSVLLTPSPFAHRSVRASRTMQLEQWLLGLSKPIGMLCAYDIQAQVVLDTCRNVAIAVPEQIAVLGVDNDSLLCNLSRPSLTSVAPDARGAGYYAAELLDRMMHRRSKPKRMEAKLMPPLRVVPRQSTDITAVDDPQVAQAIQFIRDHACDGINVGDLLHFLQVSRRGLESRFRSVTGKTPHQLITMIRLDRVQQLLHETELSLEAIAQAAGFEHAEYMNALFRKHFGIPPGRYRRQIGLGGSLLGSV